MSSSIPRHELVAIEAELERLREVLTRAESELDAADRFNAAAKRAVTMRARAVTAERAVSKKR